ncbi:ATP-binding protein [Frankia sp. AgB1.9]|uniref:ATP-binding protein n=1 Tax=unclassified Frankia TaxID=2632575 RepID=UPI00193178ED|nr:MULTISPECIES: ATP-binding protein [unclassified Frankia]MBL7488404.1 ATP-binding protein [Frankia sp. AgW1.1]MBL7547648.1 ATP-binding protein [Frankia sp. AgB1.9]MBL7622447.1 ATP-binding protein [Frankia sp. AgB1.8]
MNIPTAEAPQPTANLRVGVRQFPATTTAPALARRAADQLLQSWGLADLRGTTILLVSELLTNAVQATAVLDPRPRAVVAMRISWAAESLVIEVWDRNPKPPRLQALSPEDEGGRGLRIVEALSLAAAYYPSPTGQGKVTWCQIAAPEATPVDAPIAPLPRRQATVARTDSFYFGDLVVLRRVLDGLLALDTRLPQGDAMRQ